MIIISTYNQEEKRTTQDEELLTTLLIALVREWAYSSFLEQNAKNEISKEDAQRHKKNCAVIIEKVRPLLGLDPAEVYELMRQEEHKCQIDHTGKK